MMTQPKRRDVLAAGAAMVAGGMMTSTGGASGGEFPAAGTVHAEAIVAREPEPFLFGLNTSTIRGQKLSIVEEVAIAERAG